MLLHCPDRSSYIPTRLPYCIASTLFDCQDLSRYCQSIWSTARQMRKMTFASRFNNPSLLLSWSTGLKTPIVRRRKPCPSGRVPFHRYKGCPLSLGFQYTGSRVPPRGCAPRTCPSPRSPVRRVPVEKAVEANAETEDDVNSSGLLIPGCRRSLNGSVEVTTGTPSVGRAQSVLCDLAVAGLYSRVLRRGWSSSQPAHGLFHGMGFASAKKSVIILTHLPE